MRWTALLVVLAIVAVGADGLPLVGWLTRDTLTLVACKRPGCR